jgi:hypothetical protein
MLKDKLPSHVVWSKQQGKSNILFNGLTVARVENVNVED